MINQLVLVGKIKSLPYLNLVKSDNEIIVEVRRSYKNVDGVFEKDCFKCYLWAAVSKKVNLNCKEGDLVAIKGRLVEDGEECKIVAEQVVLLNKMMEKEVNVSQML